MYIIKSMRLIGLRDMLVDMAKSHSGIEICCSSYPYYKDYNDFVFCAQLHYDGHDYHTIASKFIEKLLACKYITTVCGYNVSLEGFINFRFRINNEFYKSDYYHDEEIMSKLIMDIVDSSSELASQVFKPFEHFNYSKYLKEYKNNRDWYKERRNLYDKS